ncbi:MAG: XrtB/PEP-CTERM-associated transcriptional regulator EpsA [Burkholderiaceae bacterium]|jgi:transcriptional regulator EpsA
MPSAFDLSESERIALVRIIEHSLTVKRHLDLFLWLSGEFQEFIPHEILIAAWGDFSLGVIHFDVISALPGVRTSGLSGHGMTAFARKLFNGWLQFECQSYLLGTAEGFKVGEGSAPPCSPTGALALMRSALVHGIRDERGRHDCLYVALGRAKFENPNRVRRMMELLAPYLDTSLRRVQHLPEQRQPVETLTQLVTDAPGPFETLGLSMREIEIMDWVRKGKTNQEIGMILNISVFTVKNHLQRVFKKLDVLNRAQAVARISPRPGRERV